jgi:tRNA pseudouridine38-40 synthase
MPRYRLTLEYDGGPFVGWQRQDNGSSVQEKIENAIFDFCGERVTVQGAGRTDAGVHALGQVAHVDLAREAAPDTVRDAVNHHLKPCPISVLDAALVADDFHARFSAIKRHYLYRIINRRAPVAVERGFVWHVARPLDAEAMHAAAQVLVGHHDFTTFRAAQCQAESPVKTLDVLRVSRAGEEIHITTAARSFLHHQVRSITGSLKLVGEGKWTARDLKKALEARDRAACGPVAPAHGLYLTRVDYGVG